MVMKLEIKNNPELSKNSKFDSVFQLWAENLKSMAAELERFERVSSGSSQLSKSVQRYIEILGGKDLKQQAIDSKD